MILEGKGVLAHFCLNRNLISFASSCAETTSVQGCVFVPSLVFHLNLEKK